MRFGELHLLDKFRCLPPSDDKDNPKLQAAGWNFAFHRAGHSAGVNEVHFQLTPDGRIYFRSE